MADQTAVRPNFVNQTLNPIVEKKAKSEGLDEAEIQLATMSMSAGWKVLTDFLDEIVETLDEGNETAIANGADFEKIGQNTLIISQTKSVIKRILNKVGDAREAYEESKNAEGTK